MPTKNGNALGRLFIAIKKKTAVGRDLKYFLRHFFTAVDEKMECFFMSFLKNRRLMGMVNKIFSCRFLGRPVLLRLFQKFVPAWGCG